MKKLNLLAGGAVAAAALYVYLNGAKKTGQQIGGAAVDLVDGVFSGGVVEIGEKVGIPKTNLNECQKAKAEGRTLDASFVCSASDFLKYVFN